MSDDPFAEPEDNDRTVIRPMPGGRRAAPSAVPPPQPASAFGSHPVPPAAPPPPAAAAPGGDAAETISFGLNPLVAAAAPLLQLLGRLRTTWSQPDVDDLRARTIQQVRTFERGARDAGVPMEQLRPAHYALCAAIDDVVLNTPWGSSGSWGAHSLVSSFHQEVRSGERFFVLLGQMRENPGAFLPVLEVLYLCLSLGFQGQYRLSQRGPAELERVREDLFAVIGRQRAATDPALSPHWQGVAAPYRPARAMVPRWVMGVGAVAVIGALFVWFSSGLNAASDGVFGAAISAPLAHMPAIQRAEAPRPVPPAPVAPQPDPLYVFLKREIDQGLVQVLGDHAMPIVRIHNAGMFASGSAVVAPTYVRLLERIGQALKRERGPVQVIGYTDNQPIHTVQFPSNYQLSKARAEAARAIVVRALGDPGRVSAEGRADADPIASNATPQGREQNRRIEIVLRREG